MRRWRNLDTSLLVAVLTREADTARMQAWLAAQEPDSLAISEWVTTEFSAALSIKLRTGGTRMFPGWRRDRWRIALR